MEITPPTTDSSPFWMWVGGILASGVSTLVIFLFGLTNSRISDARSEAKKELDEYKSTVDKNFTDLRSAVLEGQRQHLEMLTGLRELPTRNEMKHDLDVMEMRLQGRLDNLQQRDHHP